MSTSTVDLPLAPPAAAPAARPVFEEIFDRAAIGAYTAIARAFGYQIRIGLDDTLERDANRVNAEVWNEKGVKPPADLASFGERYNRAVSVWFVVYSGTRPVGAMALLDMRVASVALDYERCAAPPSLDLERTREIGRLAILPEHRGRGQIVLAGLCLEMYLWCRDNGIHMLFSGATPKLFRMYQRFNASARLITAPRLPVEDPTKARYFEAIRRYGGEGCIFTFEVAGGAPWEVVARMLATRLGLGSRARREG